jgi:hypothetical protein
MKIDSFGEWEPLSICENSMANGVRCQHPPCTQFVEQVTERAEKIIQNALSFSDLQCDCIPVI